MPTTTRYEDLAAQLRARILDGQLPPGERLPSVRALVAEHGVSDATVRAALRVLESEGLVRAAAKSGITVRERSGRRRLTRASQISHDANGYRFPAAGTERWAPHGEPKASTEPVPADVAAVFGVEAGTPLFRRRRVMSPAGEDPWDVVDAWIAPHVADEAPAAVQPHPGPRGYLARIEEAGHGPLTWEETARASMPTREEAELLGISPYMPVMRILRTGFSARDGRPAECSAYVIPADRIEIHTQLKRGPSARWPLPS